MIAFCLFVVASVAWACAPHVTHKRRALAVAASLAALGVVAVVSHGLPVVQKVIGRMLMPTGLIWLAIWALAAMLARRRDRWPALGLAVVFIGYTLAGNRALGEYAFARIESPYVSLSPLEEAAFDAVFVLGGGTTEIGDRVYLTRSGDRVVLAARLYHAGLAPVLVTSGRSVPGRRVHVDASEDTARLWLELGVPESAIVRLPDPYNTSQEIAAYAALIEERGWERVGLVTSMWHMGRAMQSAERTGVSFVPLGADRRGAPVWNGVESVIPTPSGFDLTYRTCWEVLGAAVRR